MICRTPADALAAGMAADCDHGTDPAECPSCRLTAREIASLAVLFRRPTATDGVPTPARHAA